MPRLSIGLPVYNGENFLREALDSILAQSFTDFELIVADNASTDGTQQICEAHAARDHRIRYYRNRANIGAAKNFNRVFALSSGEYFKWAAHDDILAPDFLLKCIQVLDSDPGVVLCYARTKIIDAGGQFLYNDNARLEVESAKPQHRFHDLVVRRHSCFAIFGVMRSEVLKRTPLIGAYTASDRILLGGIALYGRFHEIPEYLFCNRNHAQRSIKAYDYRARTAWFDPQKAGTIVFLIWRHLLEYCRLIKTAPLGRGERWQCSFVMVKWLRLNWKGLIYDFFAAAKQILGQLKMGNA